MPVASFGGLFWGSKMSWNSRKHEETQRRRQKKKKEEAQHATKTATILWRFLVAIFDYKTRDFKSLAIFMPTNRGYSHFG